MGATTEITGLKYFKIIANGRDTNGHEVKLFRNGRQQYHITVVIEAVDAYGHIVHLTEDQMKTVVLMEYYSEKTFEHTFARSYSWAGYDNHDTTVYETSQAPSTAMSTLEFWEHILPNTSNNRVKIAAKITLNTSVYTTNNPDADETGVVKDGGSNSWFYLQPLPPETLRADSFQVTRKEQLGGGYDSGNKPPPFDRYLEKWELSFKDTRRRIYGSSIPDTKPIPYFSQYTKGSKPWHCAWILPVRRKKSGVNSTVYLGWRKDGTWDNYDFWIRPYSTDGVAYFVIEASDHISTHDYNAWSVLYYDNFGNEHRIMVRHNDNGKTIVIADS